MKKHIIYKGTYWNYPVALIEGDLHLANESRLRYELSALKKPGTLNALTNEDLNKHSAISNYLKKELGINIASELNGNPYVLPDFILPVSATEQHAKAILEITEYGSYEVIEIKNATEKYCFIIKEHSGLESESRIKFLFESHIETEIELTKYLLGNIAYNYIIRINEAVSKTPDFKRFIQTLKYFKLEPDYLAMIPVKEYFNSNQYSDTEYLEIKREIDKLLKYTNLDLYRIEEI